MDVKLKNKNEKKEKDFEYLNNGMVAEWPKALIC